MRSNFLANWATQLLVRSSRLDTREGSEMLAPSATKTKGRNMNRKRVFAIALGAGALIDIATTSWSLADPTSSPSAGANAVQTGVDRIDPHNPQVADVSGRYSCPTG